MASTAQEALTLATGPATCTIDLYSRAIKIPDIVTVLGVQSDDDVFRLWFSVPRMFGEYDLSTFSIRINYLNANNEGDIYAVTDAEVDNDNLVFSWLIGRNACTYQGTVKFIVCFRIADTSGNITQEFNTAISTLPVLQGIEASSQIIDQYPDIIEQILQRLDTDETSIESGVKSVNGKVGTVILTAADVGAVSSVNGQTGEVNISFPVTSVNGKTGAVTIEIPAIPVESVNGKTGAVQITAEDLGAALASTVLAINDRMLDSISGVQVNETTGSMELWSKNLNQITTSGFYNAITCQNAKYNYGTLLVIAYYIEGYCTQINFDATTAGKMAIRNQINGSWSAWIEK